jgi:hypothetical protein
MKRWVLLLLVLSSPTIVMGIARDSTTNAVLAAVLLLGLILAIMRLWKPRS